MENETQQPQSPPAANLPKPPGRATRRLTALAVCLLCFAGGYGLIRWSMNNGQAAVDPPKNASSPPTLFDGWNKPDFVLVLTGQLHGYLQPCGCSEPQYGGLARRFEFIESLKNKKWRVVPVDLGDIYPKSSETPSQQNMLKYESAMRALHVMGYHAIGIGKQELGVPLVNALAQYSVNNAPPRPLAVNLAGVEKDGILDALGARPHEIVALNDGTKIGIIGMVGKSVQESLKNDPNVKFTAGQVAGALQALNGQSDFNIVLFQTEEKLTPGVETEVETCIKWCMKQKQAPVHVVLHSSDDPEPPFLPKEVGGTQMINVGHKGKFVGVLGVWKKAGGGFDYKYEPVKIGPEYEPRPGNPVASLMEDYTKRVMTGKLTEQIALTLSKHKSQIILKNDKNLDAKYIGSARCVECHPQAGKVWEGSRHSHAFDTLVKAKDPGLRQFDGECLQCHTTGFKHNTGFNDPNVTPRIKKELHHVGCESCHGPGSVHANNFGDMDARKLLNPWAVHFNKGMPENVRQMKINIFCQGCHDIENDVHWDFDKRWPQVIHMNPPPAKAGKKK